MKNWKSIIVAVLLCVIAAGGLAVLLKNNESAGKDSIGNSADSGYDIPGGDDSGGGNNNNNGGATGIKLNEYSLVF